MRGALILCVLLGGCAAAGTPPDDDRAQAIDALQERLGLPTWEGMSERQRECHIQHWLASDPVQYGDGTCESLL